MSDMDYVFAVARIRAKEKTLLSDADFRQMTGMKSVSEVLGFLSDKGWGDGSGNPTADQMLEQEEEKARGILREIPLEPAVDAVLSYPQLYHNLKAGIKEICTADSHTGIFYDIRDFDEQKILGILQERKFSALPDHMKKVAEKAMEIMVQNRDGQRCDVWIDRGCLEAVRTAGEQASDETIRNYARSVVAVSDIKIAARAQRTGKDLNFLKEALAPNDAIDPAGLAQAAAAGRDSLLSFLDSHGWQEAADALRESDSAFERWGEARNLKALRSQNGDIESPGPVVAFYLARQNEIRKARIILTGKANGFSDDEIAERVG